MIKVKLSQRLAQIASQVPVGSRVADIGSDHALLPTFLIQNSQTSFAIAGEVNSGPFEAAQKQVKEAGLTEQISVRQGDGLRVLQSSEVDVITIAGMGGVLMIKILSEGLEKLSHVKRLILQPNVAEDQVRHWLIQNDWYLSAEYIVEEDGKIYEILVADRVNDASLRNEQLYKERVICGNIRLQMQHLVRFGPYLIQSPLDVFFMKWQTELDKMKMIHKELQRSATEASRNKQAEWLSEMKFIEEVLRCLRKDKR